VREVLRCDAKDYIDCQGWGLGNWTPDRRADNDAEKCAANQLRKAMDEKRKKERKGGVKVPLQADGPFMDRAELTRMFQCVHA